MILTFHVPFPQPSGNSSSARSTPIPFTSSADTSILPIVTSQRDRFRQRNAELEEVSEMPYDVVSVSLGHILLLLSC